jgi:hypothetical protein
MAQTDRHIAERKGGAMPRPTPNFLILDGSLPDVGRLVAAMLKARQAIETRSWSHPQEPTTDEWWADVLADPRAQIRKRRGSEQAVSRTFYRLADEPRDTILVACSKCEWKAAYQRAELIAAHGPAYPMPSLLERLAAPGCPRLGSQWDRCGVHYVEPVEKPHRE